MQLVLIRGHPSRCCWVEADHFERGGVYRFDPAKLPEAHADCQAVAAQHLRAGLDTVIVSNTFVQHWEMAPYRAMAALYGATVEVVDLYDGELSNAALAARNVHGVPEGVIAKMRRRWEAI